MIRHRSGHLEHRRGVAMLLVIISVAMATVLTLGYLASRDNSAAIGSNVVEAAKARWASETGVEFAIAVLETESNWRTAHVNGKLIDNMPFGDSSLDVDLIDLQTDAPPTADTEYVQVVATAVTSGIAQIATAEAYVPIDFVDTVTVDLTEFAVFASEGVSMTDSSVLAEWPVAPLAGKKGGVAVGTQATGMGAVSFSGGATPINTTVYYDQAASAFLVSDGGTVPVGQAPIADTIPMPAPPSSGVLSPADDPATYSDGVQTGGSVTIMADNRWNNITLKDNSVTTFQGTITNVSEGNRVLQNGASVVINGDVTWVVFGDLTLQDSSIELLPGSSLTIFIGGQLSMQDSYIGNQRVDPTLRDNSGYADYMDPADITIYSIDQSPNTLWTVASNSVLKGNIYTPNVDFRIDTDSAIYGRVGAQNVQLVSTGSLFYDPALNTGTGYTNVNGSLYNVDGTIAADFKALASLDLTDLNAVADKTKKKVKSKKGKTEIDKRIEDVKTIDPITPRPVPVEWTLTSLGTNVKTWEGSQSVPTAAMLEIEVQQVRTTISSYDLTQFSGATLLQRNIQRNTLATTLASAETSINGGDYATAITLLKSVYDQIDSNGSVTDVMNDSTSKTRLASIVDGVIQNLGNL